MGSGQRFLNYCETLREKIEEILNTGPSATSLPLLPYM